MFKTKLNMEIENILIKTEHLDEDYCDIIEEEELHLKSEETIDTTNEKPFKCGICGHCTTTDTLLKVHMRMHLVKRVHQCHVCKKTFSFVTELNSHILTHTDNKSNFQCDVCGRDCFTEEDLHKHCRIHTKEKPFKCRLCCRSFSDDSYLRVHERSHHGEDYLKKAVMKEGTYVNPNHIQSMTEASAPKVSVSVQKETAPKKFKNNPNLPLNIEEKLLLLQYVEELELNKKYLQLEKIKTYVKNSWMKMVELFANSDYDRNPEKLARTYFHLKNQAKTHIERFYKHNKLPEPHKIDYMFVKLCSSDFDIPGIDVQQLLEDSKRVIKEKTSERKDNCISLSSEEEENGNNEDDPTSERMTVISEEPDTVCPLPSNFSQKRNISEEDDGPLKKLLKTENSDTELKEIVKIKLQSLLAEEQRRDNLYNFELKEKEELFNMEKKHREAINEKELEIKNLELTLLKRKIEAYNNKS